MYDAFSTNRLIEPNGGRAVFAFALFASMLAIALASMLAIMLASTLGVQSAHADSLGAGKLASGLSAQGVQVESQGAGDPLTADELASAPARVKITGFKSKVAGRVTIKVKAVAGASGYQYLIARDKSFVKGRLFKKRTASATAFRGLAEGKIYYAKVRAYKFVNGSKKLGAWSKVRRARIKKTAGVTYVKLGITLDQMAGWQPPYTAGVKQAIVRRLMNPASVKPGTAAYYQFAKLRSYSGLTAAQINNFIASTSSGLSGRLNGQGAAFVAAAKKYGVNECYLASHAILESGWGTSELAKGFKYKGKTYYNFYGIGAYDGNALSGGRGAAVKFGWTSPWKAILGAVEFVSTYYFARDQYPQDTLYGMKWDYLYSNAALARGWHQYATDPYWPSSISTLMNELYTHAGFKPSLTYEVPQYKSKG